MKIEITLTKMVDGREFSETFRDRSENYDPEYVDVEMISVILASSKALTSLRQNIDSYMKLPMPRVVEGL